MNAHHSHSSNRLIINQMEEDVDPALQLLPDFEPTYSEKGKELADFAHCDREVFFYHLVPTIDGLVRQYMKSIYDPHLALRAFERVVEEAAIIYEYDFGDRDKAVKRQITCFTPEEREDAAHQLFLLNSHVLEDGIRGAIRSGKETQIIP